MTARSADWAPRFSTGVRDAANYLHRSFGQRVCRHALFCPVRGQRCACACIARRSGPQHTERRKENVVASSSSGARGVRNAGPTAALGTPEAANLRTRGSGPRRGSVELSGSRIVAAWRYYLAHDNHGRGAVLIGHSQGNAESVLLSLGYDVTTAANGPAALAILEQGVTFDLLFTDVVMPGGMTGRVLAERARQIWPQLKVLYTSGYTENSIVHDGRLDEGVMLMSKPYSKRQLAQLVREALD